MKKYKRKTPLVSPIKWLMAVLCAAAAAVTSAAVWGTDNGCAIVFAAVAVSLLICDLFIIIGASGKYRFSDSSIDIMFSHLVYKRLDYASFNAVVVSNASYNNGYGYGVSGNLPMQYKVKDNKGYKKVTLPFITLHKPDYPVDKIKNAMNSRDLFMLSSDEIYCLGICYFDSLKELLNHTKASVYILEDVYLRFKDDFDTLFGETEGGAKRFHIISDGNR